MSDIDSEIDLNVSTGVAAGTLYVVATPIGNLGDLTPRAIDTLASVSLIAAEDTRHSQRLMQHADISTPMISLHDHNERQRVDQLVGKLRAGASIALISDAGTPLVSDPGFQLVRGCHEAGLRVSPVPGACAAIAALSAAGLPSDRFTFEGFLPASTGARKKQLAALKREPRTMVFYESPHRIVSSLTDMVDVFGADRQASVGREMTKRHESVNVCTLSELAARFADGHEPSKGEFVVMVSGADAGEAATDVDSERLLTLLLAELPPSKAVKLAVKLTGQPRAALYALAQEMSASQ